SDGRPLYPELIGNAGKKLLNSYPVIPTQRTTLGSDGDVIFGDFTHYVCPVEQEVVVARSEHRYIEKGVIVYVVFCQVGGKVVQPRAFTYLDDATS
ncbi:MAG: phage major capsid protein, partial [Planctomycetota bacterium]|nr:phage major capsid protein [Planctomycetota bacterium]